MKRAALIALLILGVLTVRPAPAWADATAFLGWSPTITNRSATGVSIGISALILGFEFEYSHINDASASGVPSLGSGMFNVLIQTPTKLSLYVTAGAGIYHESLDSVGHTNFGDNVGGGVKIPIAGPIRVRVDYRVFNLNSSLIGKAEQRIYVGANFAF